MRNCDKDPGNIGRYWAAHDAKRFFLARACKKMQHWPESFPVSPQFAQGYSAGSQTGYSCVIAVLESVSGLSAGRIFSLKKFRAEYTGMGGGKMFKCLHVV
jgi:hypothetical protein